MKPTAVAFGWASVFFGIAAAGLWLWSALVPVPNAPGAAIGGTLPNNPFNMALHKAGVLNAWAAGMTALSVFCAAVEKAMATWTKG